MSDGDIFREVDEAIRHDQLKSLWDKYGFLVLAVAVLIVAGVAGYKGWTYWQAERAAESGARFVAALRLNQDGKTQEALDAYKKIAEDGTGGYGVLARLRMASAGGDKAAAVEAYDAIAADGATDTILQGLARIQAATLRLDQADMGEMKQRLEPLTDSSNPWRHSARELLGLAAQRTGNAKDAEGYFTQVLSDREAPPSLKRRAEMMLALIVKADQSSPAATTK